MGSFRTFVLLLKGFVCAACLTVPKSFINGGYLFSAFALTFSACVTIYCALLLLEIKQKTGLTKYSEIGEKFYGTKGRTMVNISLFGSQVGFTCAYIFFIKNNFADILN
jgi:proton-coupled amino acid transporter